VQLSSDWNPFCIQNRRRKCPLRLKFVIVVLRINDCVYNIFIDPIPLSSVPKIDRCVRKCASFTRLRGTVASGFHPPINPIRPIAGSQISVLNPVRIGIFRSLRHRRQRCLRCTPVSCSIRRKDQPRSDKPITYCRFRSVKRFLGFVFVGRIGCPLRPMMIWLQSSK
jgi:hypothetical protein